MNTLWPSREHSNGAVQDEFQPEPPMPEDVADTGMTAEDAGEASAATMTAVPTTAQNTNTNTVNPLRPNLQRNISTPSLPPPPNDPPLPPSQVQAEPNEPPDSLSLAQLRRIVSEFPKAGDAVAAYDFEYEDTGPHAEEVDEWFVYGQFWQWVRLNGSHRIFESSWEIFSGDQEWHDTDRETKTRFVQSMLEEIRDGDDISRVHSIARIMYLVLGRWIDTAQVRPFGNHGNHADGKKPRSVATPDQLAAMTEGVKLLAEAGGLPIIWQALQQAFEALW